MIIENPPFVVDVAPEMQLYRILQKQSYGEETALSEFVDNSIQSFNDNEDAIKQNDEENIEFSISITIDTNQNTIIIEDNAAGIDRNHLQQAIKMGKDPNKPHLDNSLSIYGMGLKSAAIWFSDTWQLETSTIGSTEQLSLLFDLNKLLNSGSSEINVLSKTEQAKNHYTRITIFNYSRNEYENYYKNTVLPFLLETFIKFPSIKINIIHNNLVLQPNDKIVFMKPIEPLYWQPIDNKQNYNVDANKILWKKDIDFKDNDRHIRGFIILMKTGKYNQPGIRLFRNNRVISGTSVSRNLPAIITGGINKYGSQRIYGEIHLNDFVVNYQKTGFDESLENVYKQIKELLVTEPNLIKQANNFRAKIHAIQEVDSQGDTEDQQTTPKTTTDENNQNSDEQNATVTPPRRPTKIQASNNIKQKLKQINNSKLERLYHSLCIVSLSEHPILLYVGSWSFLESIAAAMGKGTNISFESYFKSKSGELYKSDKQRRNDINQVIGDIHIKGNCNKHSSIAQVINAQQLVNDFEVLEEFLLHCLDGIN